MTTNAQQITHGSKEVSGTKLRAANIMPDVQRVLENSVAAELMTTEPDEASDDLNVEDPARNEVF